MDLILAIAALCANHGQVSYAAAEQQQLCQAYYAKCVQEEGKTLDPKENKLLACMQKRVK